MKKAFSVFLIIFTVSYIYSQEKIDITGVIDWETMKIKSTVTLDLASAGLRLPAGRNRAEFLLKDAYTSLVRHVIYKLQIDSSSTIADLIEKGDISLPEIDVFPLLAETVPPFLSHDMRNMSVINEIPVAAVNNTLQRHSLPSPAARTLNPSTTVSYTGIIIIASERLPAHGLRSSYLPVPCLFPKIWDQDMNLIYERNMVLPNTPVIRYSSPKNILFNTPSGLSPELSEIVGERPLRIFASGVFGINPTDLIIDREDALKIISGEQNRSLLTHGKVVIILDESVLRQEFSF